MSKPRPYIVAETNWSQIRATDYEVVVLPWGATEAHNLHLPFGTDNMQCDYVAAEAARLAWQRGARAAVLPTVPFGVNTGQLDIKLTINMNPSTQAAVLHDVIDAVARHGFSKFVILNGHGGNNFKQMVRQAQAEFPDMFLCTLDWYLAADWSDYFDDLGDHAGEVETSTMLHIAPDLVLPLDQAGDGAHRSFKFRAFREGWAWAQREWSQVTKDTGIGNPSSSTSDKGERFLEAATEAIADFLVELSESKLDDLYR